MSFRTPSVSRWLGLAVLGLAVVASGIGAGVPPDEMEVPVAQQVSLLTRVLAFDRALAGASPLVVAVLYQDQNRSSRRAAEGVEAAFGRSTTVQGRTVRVVLIPTASASAVRAALDRAGADVAYVAPLRGVDVGAVARASAAAGVVAVTGVRRYVGAGVAVGVALRGGRPEILLNRQAAEAAGADFSARLLQLATLVD